MFIKDLFLKEIDRPIKGVIKVGQGDDGNVKQELEEYVVTRELEKHFRTFFSAYKEGIVGTTDKMGVWISGFFGSGKSHFLKILSYLLSGKEVAGKRAIDYFIEDNKISDPMVLGDMRLAGSTPTDVILFNIDSKSEMTGKQSKDAIVTVFLRVFNEMLGFCGAIPHLADLERKLSDEGRYEEFKSAFEDETGKAWTDARNDFDFIQDDIVEVLSGMDFMSEEAARNWCEKATGAYNISIEDFARLVKRYIDSQGNNHHVVFLVDEIGQYIGDNSDLMLNLQTVTEDLGTFCLGKVWIMVTSQQDIDAVTKVNSNDFSKIQGRFDTRLSLSSANVDEVIRKRILEKKESGAETLALLYDTKDTFIKNLIQFSDAAEKKLYSNRLNFADVYPFVPYQFNLLGDVLTSVRLHGASGKHLSEGERSMLAVFKESAEKIKDEEPGALVPFNLFYDALEKFLDHSHSGVISRARDNEKLNPDHSDDCFTVNVLKTLFLIKYVKEIEKTLDNITSLMVSNIDDDRLELKKRVEDALNQLIRQTLVEKVGNAYIFLTNEEQEVNRQIERFGQNIEQSQIINEVSEIIFDGLYDEKRYRHPSMNGRYQFAFNQVVDNRPYKTNQNNTLTLKILTPYSDEMGPDEHLRAVSGQDKVVLIALPNDTAFLDEIRMAISIESFITDDAKNTVSRYADIVSAKKKEMSDHKANAKLYLEEALKNATVYVHGSPVQGNQRDYKAKISDGMGRLVSLVYHKLTYIDTPVTDSDIKDLLTSKSSQIDVTGSDATCNALALSDVSEYIGAVSAHHTKLSLKSVMDRFMNPPYGFVEVDVEWLVTKLFRTGEIAFYVNSVPVTLLNKTPDEILKLVTRKDNLEKLMMDRREKATEKQKKSVKEIMKQLFKIAVIPSDEDDALMNQFQKTAQSWITTFNTRDADYRVHPNFPGSGIIKKGLILLNEAVDYKVASEFYREIDRKKDDFLDLAEDYEHVRLFWDGEQHVFFEKAVKLMATYDDSKTYIVDEELEKTVDQVKAILKMPSPYGQIHLLPSLNDKFSERYNALLDKQLEPVEEAIAEAKKAVFAKMVATNCQDQFRLRFTDQYDRLLEKARRCNNISQLRGVSDEADALKIRQMNEIDAYLLSIAPPPIVDPAPGPDTVKPHPPIKPLKKTENISFKTITPQRTWQVETEEDVDKYISDLEARLKKMLKENTIFNIQF